MLVRACIRCKLSLVRCCKLLKLLCTQSRCMSTETSRRSSWLGWEDLRLRWKQFSRLYNPWISISSFSLEADILGYTWIGKQDLHSWWIKVIEQNLWEQRNRDHGLPGLGMPLRELLMPVGWTGCAASGVSPWIPHPRQMSHPGQ